MENLTNLAINSQTSKSSCVQIELFLQSKHGIASSWFRCLSNKFKPRVFHSIFAFAESGRSNKQIDTFIEIDFKFLSIQIDC